MYNILSFMNFFRFCYEYNCKRDLWAQTVKYKHFGAMDSELQAFINATCGLTLGAQQCICYACAKQLARNKSNPLFKPRWLPKETSKKCNVSLCKNPWRSNTTVEIDC